MELSNDSFLALLEERISKRDGNSGKKPIQFLLPYDIMADRFGASVYADEDELR